MFAENLFKQKFIFTRQAFRILWKSDNGRDLQPERLSHFFRVSWIMCGISFTWTSSIGWKAESVFYEGNPVVHLLPAAGYHPLLLTWNALELRNVCSFHIYCRANTNNNHCNWAKSELFPENIFLKGGVEQWWSHLELDKWMCNGFWREWKYWRQRNS